MDRFRSVFQAPGGPFPQPTHDAWAMRGINAGPNLTHLPVVETHPLPVRGDPGRQRRRHPSLAGRTGITFSERGVSYVKPRKRAAFTGLISTQLRGSKRSA